MIKRAGIDTGGTFTDAVIASSDGGWEIYKCPTTQHAPALAVIHALAELTPKGQHFVELVHGTTHATNALLTGKLGRVCFITTKGHGDILEIGRQERDSLYALEPRPPRPQQARRHIIEVDERLSAEGKTICNLTRAEINRVCELVKRQKPQAIAICFLHAWREGKHEKRLARALKKLQIPIVQSHLLAPEQREYERATTTWADAGLQSVVAPALCELAGELAKGWNSKSRLRVMRSDGGTASAEAAAAEPVHLALSGPAGGLSAARTLADARGDRDILTLDMGGTSTDVALLLGGELALSELTMAGLPLLARGLPLHTIGTGGGSLAHLDAAGELQVGPQSAGAVPGPICYRRGGKQLTVTDAHLHCGRLHPRRFLDGKSKLDLPSVITAAKKLKRSACEILEIASAEMERALRKVSLAAGHDPRRLVLYAFGGAGGLHAAWMAERLGMPEVVIPPKPGVFSALGLLTAPARRSLSKTVLTLLPPSKLRKELFVPLMDKVVADLKAEGVPGNKIKAKRILELRSQGQSAVFALAEGANVEKRFHAAHRQRFGYQRAAEIELLAIRVQADGPSSSAWPRQRCRKYTASALERRSAQFPECGGIQPLNCSWYQREELKAGAQIVGPAVIAEYSSTTVVPPNWCARVDAWGCLSLKKVTSK